MADTSPTPLDQGLRALNTLSKNSDLFIALSAIGVVLMLIVPIPPFLLDIMLLLNLSLSFLIILSTMYVVRPADFSAFPTLILLTTVFGLALNVSSTRLILTQGQAGTIISAFGNFVAGGNLVVGFVIFIVLLAIQFLVITKGATRVSEVSARFALDALPGKQLTINEELNSGSITAEEAQVKRSALSMEVGFYGAMDGSSKFVSGNVQVAVVIVIVNIIGGIIAGSMRGEGLAVSAQKYTILTIGDGLVSQIPALLVSVATGIIVTRNSANEKFASDVAKQIVMLPKTLYITASAIFLIGVLPGFPFFLTTFIAILFGGSAYLMSQSIQQEENQLVKDKQAAEVQDNQPTIQDILHIDPMSLEIGIHLIPLFDASQGGDLLDRIKQMRRVLGLDLGLLVPQIRITDNVSLNDQEYIVKIRGEEIGRGRLHVRRLLALNPKLDLNEIEGIESLDPTYNLPAKWIATEDRNDAEKIGFSLYTPATVLSTHLTELIRKNAWSLLTRQDIQKMMDALRAEFPAIVDDALKASNIGEIHKILQGLLKEKIKIRNMVPILETIADRDPQTKTDQLIEKIRQVLSKQIFTDPAISTNNVTRVLLISPDWEEILTESSMEPSSNWAQEQVRAFVQASGELIEEKIRQGMTPVILCSSRIRRIVREILVHSFDVPVLAYTEVPSGATIEQLGVIK
ncbi:MAG: flagellar biosynthesis protein FlhA [Brevinema sp.]